jgi:ABC-type lipoprotein export system ATPase subunit
MNNADVKETAQSDISREIGRLPLSELIARYPFLDLYLSSAGIEVRPGEERPLPRLLETLESEEIEDKAIDSAGLLEGAESHIQQMLAFLGGHSRSGIGEISILPGQFKNGEAETFGELHFRRSETISIVGPTGSGKSRLLADIEWMAQGDTPTGRKVLVDGKQPDRKWRFSTSDKLVAQLSQNMNFVMDLTVREFVQLHAESRMTEEPEKVVEAVIAEANELAGERFSPETAITSLSGGQSRALMIADTAILSKSPIVLIDEIENAGIDRKKALSLLLSEEKIVLMATHDPILALMADRRIVIKNGGVHKVIETSDEERRVLNDIEKLDRKVQSLRTMLRTGETLTGFSF